MTKTLTSELLFRLRHSFVIFIISNQRTTWDGLPDQPALWRGLRVAPSSFKSLANFLGIRAAIQHTEYNGLIPNHSIINGEWKAGRRLTVKTEYDSMNSGVKR